MKNEHVVLYGRKLASEPWQEEILSTNPAIFNRVKVLAAKDGFGYFRIAVDEKLAALVEAAQSAAEWMTEAHPGTDQYERGVKLQKAVDDVIRWNDSNRRTQTNKTPKQK